MTSLAILGAKPAFPEKLHVGRPNIGNRKKFLQRMEDMLDRRWLTNDGPFVKEFESRIAEYAGVKHCVAITNATIALGIAARALELAGEVIVPSFTFVATAHALQWQGISPVFGDIDPHTYNLDPDVIERLITPRTSGIVGVHVWGRACAPEALEAIGRKHQLKVMFDAAHAFGCSHAGRMVGGFGSCEVLSFHATKFLNSFEGGAIVTNDDALAGKARRLRNFGFDNTGRVVDLGTNGKMSEACAAMGLTSLEAIDELIAVNRRNYEAYREHLGNLSGVSLVSYTPEDRHNYQYIIIELNPDLAPLTRDELVQVLEAENILARKYFWPGCHEAEPYLSRQPQASQSLAVTERLVTRVLQLPTGQAITPDDVKTICDIIRTALAKADQVRASLPPRS